ncbi:MAG: hypothetical protein Q8M16_16655 [Pirellulaceae bacterium]|nr:hypothetical protein [Pirellulaceae bacterium]
MSGSTNSRINANCPQPSADDSHEHEHSNIDPPSWPRGSLLIVLKLVKVVWASPNSLLGVCVGGVGLIVGTRVRFRGGCIEFWGGSIPWIFSRLPVRPGAMALGHVVLAIDEATLHRAGPHERIHVRQYERWGPLFLPAYGIASWWAWRRGRRAYRDNPFEVEAYEDDARRAALETTRVDDNNR